MSQNVILFYKAGTPHTDKVLSFLGRGDTLVKIYNNMNINLHLKNTNIQLADVIRRKYGITNLPALYLVNEKKVVYGSNNIINYLNPKRIYEQYKAEGNNDEDFIQQQQNAFLYQGAEIRNDTNGSSRITFTDNDDDDDDDPLGGSIDTRSVEKRVSEFNRRRNPKLTNDPFKSAGRGNNIHNDFDDDILDQTGGGGGMRGMRGGGGGGGVNDGGDVDIKSLMNQSLGVGGDN